PPAADDNHRDEYCGQPTQASCAARAADAHRVDQICAAAATADATAGPTRGSSGLGTIRSGARSSLATEKMASAAATFIFSVIRRAPASSAPRNTPGNASTLLIWFGKSLRPVATTDAYLAAT